MNIPTLMCVVKATPSPVDPSIDTKLSSLIVKSRVVPSRWSQTTSRAATGKKLVVYSQAFRRTTHCLLRDCQAQQLRVEGGFSAITKPPANRLNQSGTRDGAAVTY